ncbi:MAG: formylglycine-generating enzyme family protein [Bdellovibrionales bacterium]|jgi:formylglycine-generating enzyme required for sulfatase activity|nr:formylglycine-generating enzyme family protein [Bdellovibrionales bacterium]
MKKLILFIVLPFLGCASVPKERGQDDRVLVPSGLYSPLFREPGEQDQPISSFYMDRTPVTRERLYVFLEANESFKKDKIVRRLADAAYLDGWPDGKPQLGTENWPVTSVSWFVARAYCREQGGRLPTIAEWEYAANAQDPDNLKKILAWYAKPGDALDPVESLRVDRRGLAGMHGVIWEWVEDFSSVLLQGDSRSSNDTDGELFCGAGALNAKRPDEYATFMRFAFRSSLKASSTVRTLGFRCAYDGARRVKKDGER